MATAYIDTFHVSVYTSAAPVGKVFSRRPDGTLAKRSLGHLSDGTVDSVQLRSLEEFAKLREGLTRFQALGYGLSGYEHARVVTGAALERALGACSPEAEPIIARDSRHLKFPRGPGVLMLDYDPPDSNGLSAQDLHAALCGAVPELQAVTMVWCSSAGSMIFDGSEERVGLRGSRLYMVISDAERTREIGELLFDRLVLSGHGRIALSGAGRMLHRSLIDGSVWQPERLDFVRATCEDGLDQRPMAFRLFEGVDAFIGDAMLDVSSLQPLTSQERSRVREIWKDLETESAEPAREAQRRWANRRAEEECAQGKFEPAQLGARIEAYEAAASGGLLDSSHPLQLHDGRSVTVGHLLASPAEFDRVRMADPLEPGYNGDSRVALALLRSEGGRPPVIYSHAHGGVMFRLSTADQEFDADDESDLSSSAPVSRRRFRPIQAADFRAGPPPAWHIRDVLPQSELCMVYGESGSGKSFVVLDMMAAVASGREWRGLQVTRGAVVYIVAEGRAGFRKRLDAFGQEHRMDLGQLDLFIVSECPDLLNGDEAELAQAIKESCGASIVVIDTLSRTLSGGDENSSVDMGRAVKACGRIHQATGATVLLVHHSGKDVAKGARGWSGLKAAVDAELEVSKRGARRYLRVTKQKDGVDAGEYPFDLVPVRLGVDDDLHEISSCVIKHVDGASSTSVTTMAPERGKWQRKISQALAQVPDGVSRDALVAKVVGQTPKPSGGQRDARTQQVKRALAALLARGGYVEHEGMIRAAR